jgi:hypothetical protein
MPEVVVDFDYKSMDYESSWAPNSHTVGPGTRFIIRRRMRDVCRLSATKWLRVVVVDGENLGTKLAGFR